MHSRPDAGETSRRRPGRRPSLLILYVERARGQPQNFAWSQKRLTFLRVVVVEELEPREFDRLLLDVRTVRIELEPRRTPSVHVHHDLNAGITVDLSRSSKHSAREPVD